MNSFRLPVYQAPQSQRLPANAALEAQAQNALAMSAGIGDNPNHDLKGVNSLVPFLSRRFLSHGGHIEPDEASFVLVEALWDALHPGTVPPPGLAQDSFPAWQRSPRPVPPIDTPPRLS